MLTRRRALVAAIALVVLIALAGVAGLVYFFGNKAPGAASIDSAAIVAASADPNATAMAGGTLDGTCTVDTSIGSFSDYSSSWAGFRVDEVLSNIGNNTAIGRTPYVSGTLMLDGQTLTQARILVDLTTITSDQPRRDPAIQRTLQTGTYPTAIFQLSQPVSLPQQPAEGVTYDVTAVGDMNLHGVRKHLTVSLQVQLRSGTIIVVGSTPFAFADYNMSAPAAPIVLSVSDSGTIEFQLFFRHS